MQRSGIEVKKLERSIQGQGLSDYIPVEILFAMEAVMDGNPFVWKRILADKRRAAGAEKPMLSFREMVP
jgi:hypothetical protein